MQQLIFSYYDLHLQINARKLSCSRRNHQDIDIVKKNNFEIIIERGGELKTIEEEKIQKQKKSVFQKRQVLKKSGSANYVTFTEKILLQRLAPFFPSFT